MAGVGALNLSLLSRGIGEVQTNGHEKVEVFLEPEDYYNFVNSDRYYLPPIKTNFSFGHGSSSLSTRGSREFNEIHLPKTFTTRKGALLLFSEDLALRDKEREATHKNAETLSIHTVEDLARSILSYGSHERQTDSASVYMKFLHQKREMKRQIRPGFSAKRYLATWTRTWDDSVLETVISKGYITERSLFHYNLVIPHLRRRLIAEDLSHYPAPYRLMRSMLLYPGSLSGYTFYRAVTETEDLFEEQKERAAARRVKASSTIRVIKTQQDGLQKEVSYASLDRTSQEEVITDLLVKSAVHFALKKQQEYVEETMKEIDDSRRVGSAEIRKISAHTPVPDFNMKEAVESLLDSHRSGTSALDADFPEVENTSHSSDYGGSFKGCTIPKHEKTRHKSGSRSWTYEGSEKEYIGSTPVVTLREGVSPILTSNIPHLPPIKSKVPLTPILDVSREQTQQHLPLPPIDKLPHVNILSPTPQHTILSGVSPSVDRVGQAPSEVEETGSEWGISSVHSERDRGFRHVSTQWKGSQQSLKSSKKGSGSVIGESVKGSVVCAPDGEIVKVGGSILPDTASLAGSQTARTDLDRGIGGMEDTDVSDNEPDMWKSREDIFNIPSEEKSTSTKEASQKESAESEQMIVDALTGHAQKIAAKVLSKVEAGRDLEADIREAVEEITRHRANSAAPTAQEYKDLIRQSLTTAVAMVAGKEPNAFPFDAEVSPELLDALASQSLSPDDIEIVTDDEGRNIIRSKSHMLNELGGVKEGHIYISGGSTSDRSLKKTISIPSERGSAADVGDYDVINYNNADVVSDRKSSVRASVSSSPEPDDFTKALQNAETESKKSSGSSKHVVIADDVKSAKTTLSQASKKSMESKSSEELKKSKAKKKSLLDRDEFVVGKPKAQKPKKEPVPPKKEEKKKAVKKKGKKAKKEEPAPPKAATPPPKPATPPPPSPPKAKTPPKPATPEQSISPISSVEKSDDEMEFIIIRDETPSPEPVRPRKEPSPVREPSPKTEPPSEPQSEDEDTALKSITSKEARAAKRAAAANKRREEVERRRREREEQLKREKEEQERQERLRREMEEERRKLEEERRLRRQREAAEREKEEEEERERERRKQLELEREKRQKEEYARKLEEMKKRQAEEDLKRQELQRQRELEEEERRKEEELRMSQMAEQERLEYERKKKEEEELRKLKEEEDRKRREEQAQRALEEARRLAEDMARRQAELEQRLRFNRELQLEAGGLEHTQDITRMFVFSYFELLQWLGLDIPEFELQKLNSL